MWQHLRNALIVIGVTALIWFFAEAESLRSAEVRSVEVVFQSDPASRYFIDLSQDSPGVRANTVRVDMLIEGPAAAIEPVERTLRQPILVSPGMDGIPAERGSRPLDLLTVLSHHPDLRGRGVTFRSLSPEVVDATVDELVTRSVKVVADVGDAALEGPPELKTTVVSLTVPASLATRITDQTTVTARVDAAQLARLGSGRKETVTNVRLQPPAELAGVPRVRIEPSGADVSVTLRSKATSIKVASVPVHVRLAPSELSKWDIEVSEQDRFLNDVTITGPAEVIRQVQDKTLPLVATVSLSFEELERGTPSKDAVFSDLPPGVRVDVANKTVRLKITRRDAGRH